MRCQNCGSENPAGSATCVRCNRPLAGTDSSSSATNYPTVEGYSPKNTVSGCPSCGYPLKESDKKCPNCGSPVYQPAPTVNIDYVESTGATVIAGRQAETGKMLAGFLVSYSSNPYGEYFPVYEGRNLVGRGKDVNIHIDGDSEISDHHFSILYRAKEKKYKFKDELSSNGTVVNDEIMDAGELHNLDVITLGSTRLLFIAVPEF